MKLKAARTAVAGALLSAFAFTLRSEAASGMFVEHNLSTNIDLVAVTAVTTCEGLQEVLQGEYVLDLAGFRETATTALQLLDENEELRPYAAWLRTRLDYLAVADELQIAIAPPGLELQPRPAPTSSPSPDLERRAWRDHLKGEGLPVGARLYVQQLKPVFVEEGVPAELVWLAEVESGFEPRARSPVGAAGLFQLMPDTAELLGLSLRPRDDRLVPVKSARAAAQYLRYLHLKFGDWRLAFAAYNAGEGRVRRLLTQHRARSYDEIAVHLPAETQMYVPKVEATILRREEVALNDLKSPAINPASLPSAESDGTPDR
jgi:membrane-bound lytic murein transglycosylase D